MGSPADKATKTSPIRISIEPPDTPPCDNFKTNGTLSTHPGLLDVKFRDTDKDSIISSTCSIDKQKPKIPDGGWGWVIVASSLVISLIADGLSFCFGLLYIEFLAYFGASKSATSWIGSLFVAVPLLTGPIMSAFVDRYGCRLMTIIGGVLATIGFVLSYPVNSIGVMYVTFGVVSGLGLGVCYVTLVVSIAYWFDKKRTFAIGLGACGTGIGTFVYAPLTTYLIGEYGWRGTILILAGTLLNLCVCGAVMREPEWLIEQEKRLQIANKKTRRNLLSKRSVSESSDCPSTKELRKLIKSEDPDYILQTLFTSRESSPTPEAPQHKVHHQSLVNLPTFVKQSEKVPVEVLQQLSSNKRMYHVILENYPSILLCNSTLDKTFETIPEEKSISYSRPPINANLKMKKANKEVGPVTQFERQEFLPNKYEVEKLTNTKSINEHREFKKKSTVMTLKSPSSTKTHLKNLLRKHPVVYRGAMYNLANYRLYSSSCPDISSNSMMTLHREFKDRWNTDWKTFLKNMVDFSLFLDLHFLFMSIGTMLLFTWCIVPYFYIAEHITRHGYTERDASMIISVIGITNTIGMIGLGWAGDQPWLHVTKAYAVCLIMCGITCIFFMFFTNNYVMLLTTAALFGIFFSSTFSFTPAIIVELISLDNFTQAYGLSLLCQGVGHLLGPPLAGALFDITGTWEQSFWQAGIWIIVAGVFIGFIPYTKNRKLWKRDGDRDFQSDVTSVAY